MIIYGWSSKIIKPKKLSGVTCPNCSENKLSVAALIKYATLFWIPIFPYSKKISVLCESCAAETRYKNLNAKIKSKVDLIKSDLKTPFYMFSGLIIISCLFMWLFYSIKTHEKELTSQIKSLTPEDILVYKTEGSHGFMKIIENQNDTILFVNANYVYDGKKPSKSDYKTSLIGKEDFYNEEIYYYTQYQIDSLYEANYIIQIFRE